MKIQKRFSFKIGQNFFFTTSVELNIEILQIQSNSSA